MKKFLEILCLLMVLIIIESCIVFVIFTVTGVPREYSQAECKKAIEYLERKGTRYDR